MCGGLGHTALMFRDSTQFKYHCEKKDSWNYFEKYYRIPFQDDSKILFFWEWSTNFGHSHNI